VNSSLRPDDMLLSSKREVGAFHRGAFGSHNHV
jgi:hypothetical protein